MEHSINPNDANTEASSLAKSLHITLELDGDDPAFTNSIGLDVVTTLQDEGYSIEPVYTGQRGGGLLVEIGMTLAQALTFVKDNHAAISEGIRRSGWISGDLHRRCATLQTNAACNGQTYSDRTRSNWGHSSRSH